MIIVITVVVMTCGVRYMYVNEANGNRTLHCGCLVMTYEGLCWCMGVWSHVKSHVLSGNSTDLYAMTTWLSEVLSLRL